MSLRSGLSMMALMLAVGLASRVQAEPYLAVQAGYKCSSCHVNPTGGGLRNDFGLVYAQNVLPATTLGDGTSAWAGKLAELLRVGGDLRTSWARNDVPDSAATQQFGVDQMRIYGEMNVIRDRLSLYLDEKVAPNSAENFEAYVKYMDPSHGWYVKGGKFYLPFGWRLQDQTSFVREVTGISMTTPDQGVEFGYDRDAWSARVAFTNGAANAQSSGNQITGQMVYVQTRWRAGLAASHTRSDAGNRNVVGVFAGLRTGPVVWLGEADLVSDDGFPEGRRRLASLLGEADWNLAKGHNLKFTAECYDPDRRIGEDQQTRWSLLYEFTPIQYLQIRAGYRRYRGIPQNGIQNHRLTFIELHGFF